MKNIKHLTLAALRNENPAEFDSAIKRAVYAAAEIVGKDVVIRAICNPSSISGAEFKRFAA